MSLTRRRMLAGLTATGALSALPGCVSTNQATGRTSFTGLSSLEDDIKVGKENYPKLIKAFGGRYEDPKMDRYVTDLGTRLAANAEYQQFPYTFAVLNTPIVNAFALPGGYVSVSRGLLALASNEAELAGVLAHELGHVNARHSAERQSAAMLGQIFATGASILTGSSAVGQIANVAATAFVQGYSQKQEFEADSLGVRYMSKAGYNPDAMVTFLDTLRDHSMVEAEMLGLPPGKVDEYNMMSTHPRTKDRVQAAVTQAETLRPEKPVLGRDRYLGMVNGLLYGDDPDQGIIFGRRFVHPDMRFEFTVPLGFRLVNDEKKVTAKHAEGASIVFDIGKMKSRDMTNYLANEWGRSVSVGDVEALRINGEPAAIGRARLSTRSGTVTVHPLAIRRDDKSAFRMLFISPKGQENTWNTEFRRTTYSFRRLSAAEAAKVKPLRMIVAQRHPNDTLAKLADKMPYGEYNEAAFRVLNDLKPGEDLPARGDIKLIVH